MGSCGYGQENIQVTFKALPATVEAGEEHLVTLQLTVPYGGKTRVVYEMAGASKGWNWKFYLEGMLRSLHAPL